MADIELAATSDTMMSKIHKTPTLHNLHFSTQANDK